MMKSLIFYMLLQKDIELKSLAKTTVGIKDTSISLHLIQLIELIELYTKQIKDIEIKITDIVNNLDTQHFYQFLE